MLILKLDKINFVSSKNKMTILENVHKKLFFLILFILITSFYLLPKINNTFTETTFNFLNKILINNGFIIKNIEVLGVNHLDKNDIIKIISTNNNINIFNVNIKLK